MLKPIVLALLILASIFEFTEIERESWEVHFGRDISSDITGTLALVIAVLIWLFG